MDMDRLARLRVYPNIYTEAYYDPLTMVICMSKYDRTDPKLAQDIRFNRVLAHERQHWEDHVCTYWGIRESLLAYNAIHAWKTQAEENFWRIPLYFSSLRKRTLQTYYSVVNSDSIARSPHSWKWRITYGLGVSPDGRLDQDKPITFASFANSCDNSLVARVPLTIESFLEARAISKELVTAAELISFLKTSDLVTYHVEKKALENMGLYYTPKLLVYSVLAHIVSTVLRVNDVETAFNIASQISHLMLNLSPSIDLAGMKISESLEPQSEILIERQMSMIKNRDYGFMFYNTLLNYAESGFYTKNKQFCKEDYLKASNLPSLQEWEETCRNDLLLLKNDITEGSHTSKFHQMIDFCTTTSTLFGEVDLTHHPSPFTLYYGDDMDWSAEKEELKDLFGKCECFFSVCTI